MPFANCSSELRAVVLQIFAISSLWASLLVGFAFADEAVAPSQRKLPLPERPSFVQDIQPILAKSCTGCHGGVKQAGGLSFVYASSVLPPDGWVIEPGKPDESILLERITSDDPDLRMPPPEEHPHGLSEREIELIRRWIEQGAEWQDHWSRTPLVAPEVPATPESSAWAKQPLDHFVWNRLQEQSLLEAGHVPAAAADGAQWLRRVSLDLIGLPPTPQQLNDFEAKLQATTTEVLRDQVYEQEVQRLLASPHFGERWAALWMDLARYADSQGFEKDPHRDMWPYRDWLISAFNQDMPYDEFTVKQLAGDLLPDASLDDLVATAFHRNTQTNTEGGTDDEEFRMAAVIDRLNTTWTVWQATTFGCVQCHAHPYEPFENEEFYAGLALFNNTQDVDLNSEFPVVHLPSDPDQRKAVMDVAAELRAVNEQRDQMGRDVVREVDDWRPLAVTTVRSTSGKVAALGGELRVVAGTVAVGSIYEIEGYAKRLTGLRLQIIPDSEDPKDWPEQGSVASQVQMEIIKADGAVEPVKLTNVIPDHRGGAYECESSLNGGAEGFGGYPKLFQPRWMVLTLDAPIALASDETLKITIQQKASVTGGLSNHLRRFRLEYSSADQLCNLQVVPEYARLTERRDTLKKQQASFTGVRLPVAQELPANARRVTRQFIRGNWLERGKVVSPGIPAVFQSDPLGGELDASDRLVFAKWLVSPRNPLSARVWANRVWAELFGRGLVETQEDFGVSGLPPTHPGLLDHLAFQLQHQQAWSLKKYLRTVVLSATYRQDSRVSKRLREQDPQNHWLGRGPRTRLTAEMVRDQALVAAGVMTEDIGGPSVMPPQPDGVWQQVYSGARWEEAEDKQRYRRGVYTYWKRTSPYPGFVMFDTPNRDVCSPRRIATNTPLQALVTLNSQVYTELAAELAQRSQAAHGQDDETVIRDMFLRVTSRRATEQDLASLSGLLTQLRLEQSALEARTEQQERPPSPNRVASQETSEPEKNADQQKLSPMAIVALAILNSDWALSK